MRTAIIGGGLAALTLAGRLPGCTLFDKARGPGGRLSNRRGDGARHWHHGCPWLTAERGPFRRQLDTWAAAGVVEPLAGEIVGGAAGQRYVGTAAMSAPGKALAEGAELHRGTRIVKVSGGTLTDDAGGTHTGFDRIVLAVPAPQAAELCPELPITATMAPQWAGLFVAEPDVGYVASYPDADDATYLIHRTPGTTDCWTLLATAAWSEANLERDKADVAADLAGHFARLTGATPTQATAHRWRYSRTVTPQGTPYLQHGSTYAIGDWLLGDTAEHAYESATALADTLT